MKKNLLLLIFSLFVVSLGFSQRLQTNYSKSTNSNFCGEEKFEFILSPESITRIDKYDGSKQTVPSKKESGGFDKHGHYLETWTSKFYLNQYGINQYNRIQQFSYRIAFDKRGGDLLYILEVDNKKGIDKGKIYLSQAGYRIICK